MQVILSYFVFFLIYFTIQVLLYRFFKINLNKLLFILFSITVSVAFGSLFLLNRTIDVFNKYKFNDYMFLYIDARNH